MIGLARKKKIDNPDAPDITPATSTSLDATPIPSWMSGEAPNPPRRKRPRVDSGGQLGRGAMRAA